MRKWVIDIAWGVGLGIAAKLIWLYTLWTYDAYYAVGEGLDPRGLLSILAYITLAGSGFMLCRGIIGHHPFGDRKDPQEETANLVLTNGQTVVFGMKIGVIPAVLAVLIFFVRINFFVGLRLALIWNTPLGILGGIIGALIGKSINNETKNIQDKAIFGTIIGTVVGIVLAFFGLSIGGLIFSLMPAI